MGMACACACHAMLCHVMVAGVVKVLRVRRPGSRHKCGFSKKELMLLFRPKNRRKVENGGGSSCPSLSLERRDGMNPCVSHGSGVCA